MVSSFNSSIERQHLWASPGGSATTARRLSYVDAYKHVISQSVDFSKCVANEDLEAKLATAQRNLKRKRLNCLTIVILRISNFVIKLFKKNFSKIDALIDTNKTGNLALRKITELRSPKTGAYTSLRELDERVVPSQVKIGLYRLQTYQFDQFRERLRQFNDHCKSQDISDKDLKKAYRELPKYLQTVVKSVAELNRIPNPIENHLRWLADAQGEHPSVVGELDRLLETQTRNYNSLIEQEERTINGEEVAPKEKQAARAKAVENDQAFYLLTRKTHVRDESDCVYSVSAEKMSLGDDEALLAQPITVTMVSVEYKGLMQKGGLAEAVEGMSRGILEQCPGNSVRLIYPLFSDIPSEVKDQLGEPEEYMSSKGKPYNVYSYEKDGVECQFIEDPAFVLSTKDPDIYGPNAETQSKRFATFTELAADLIYEQRDETDIIHLHDWHVAGVASKLKNDHPDDWKEGGIPPVFFTYHNNGRMSQGRIIQGPYSYDPVVKGYQDSGIIKNNENLFVETLKIADGISTVSETFGLESQQLDKGFGVSFAAKKAAKAGKLAGIVNGVNTSNWNPATDAQLRGWRDPDTGEPVDLTYGPEHPVEEKHDIVAQKTLCKQQLQKWAAKYAPQVHVDFSKPIVTFVGRFDSTQKGLDKFEEAIEATLRNGGQFICMGVKEDPEATALLDELQAKYTEGVFFIRDFEDGGKVRNYQNGIDERGIPAIGKLVRGVTDICFVPSKFEPCGLVQYEAWLYGALTVGSETGGLADTIITMEKDESKFNGFLFRRDGTPEESARQTIERALQYTSSRSKDEMNALLGRVMVQAKQSSWTTSPTGLSPVAQYRIAYANAMDRVRFRKTGQPALSRIEKLKRRVLLDKPVKPGKKPTDDELEENYLRSYYSGKHDSKSLEAMYKLIPEDARALVPSPYGSRVNFKKHEHLGALYNGNGTTSFRVSAPGAKKVKLILISDTGAVRKVAMMRNIDGEWETCCLVQPGQKYQYIVNGVRKLDPYGKAHDFSPNPTKKPCSVVVDGSYNGWTDAEWIREREENAGKSKPMSIYEVHPAIWKKENGKPLNYRQLAEKLVEHCDNVGYTHVELMGIMEHADESSWGYRVTGYFAPNSRMGSVEDFKYMVNYLHEHKISVILDWVPAHFSKEDFSLADFDGNNMYDAKGLKYLISSRSIGHRYGAKHFDFNKKETREFLYSSAAYWLQELHIDGLRVDCIASLYRSEDRPASDLFIRDLNAVVHKHCKGAISIAEDYTGNRNTTASSHKDGYDFDMKWHVAWMKHFFDYIEKPINKRKDHYDMLRSSIDNDNWHKQIMYISHDQFRKAAHSLLHKTPNMSDEEKLANVKAMLSYMMCLPGKKLLFMGADMADENFWGDLFGQTIGLMDRIGSDRPEAQQLMGMMKELNELYKGESALHELDDNGHDMDWIEDPSKRVHAYRRVSSDGNSIACFHNFTNEAAAEFTVTIKGLKNKDYDIVPCEIFNSDSSAFGGAGRINADIAIQETKTVTARTNRGTAAGATTVEESETEATYTITIPPLSTVMVHEGRVHIEQVEPFVENAFELRKRIRAQTKPLVFTPPAPQKKGRLDALKSIFKRKNTAAAA